MKTFLGLNVKTKESKWNLIEGSVKKMNRSALKQVKSVSINQSEYSDDLYLLIDLGNEEYVTCTLDRKCKLQEGDKVDPSTILVYDLTNGEKTIKRCFAEELA